MGNDTQARYEKLLQEDKIKVVFQEYYYYNFNYDEYVASSNPKNNAKLLAYKSPKITSKVKKDELILPSISKGPSLQNLKELDKLNDISNAYSVKGTKNLKKNPSALSISSTNSTSGYSVLSSNIPQHKKVNSIALSNFESNMNHIGNINGLFKKQSNINSLGVNSGLKKSFSLYKLN